LPDWPNQPVLPLHLGSRSRWCETCLCAKYLVTNFTEASSAWPAVNRILYIPMAIPWIYPLERFWWFNGAAAGGAYRFGVYAFAEDTLVKVGTDTGSVTGTGNSLLQYAAPTGGRIMIGPGRYYIAMQHDDVTASRIISTSTITPATCRGCGMLEETPGAMGLPTVATPVAYSSATGGLPIVGFTRTATGF
jgi:hypothetical protein